MFNKKYLHIYMAIFWIIVIVPIYLFFRESVFVVLLISCYANAVGHIASYEGQKAGEVDEDTRRRLKATAKGLAALMEVLAEDTTNSLDREDLREALLELEESILEE